MFLFKLYCINSNASNLIIYKNKKNNSIKGTRQNNFVTSE